MIASAATAITLVEQRLRQRRGDPLRRQRLHDDTGGKRQDLPRSQPRWCASASQTCSARRNPSAPVPALALPVFTPGRAPRSQVLFSDDDWRRAKAVLREDGRYGRTGCQPNHQQVLAIRLAHPAIATPSSTARTG